MNEHQVMMVLKVWRLLQYAAAIWLLLDWAEGRMSAQERER